MSTVRDSPSLKTRGFSPVIKRVNLSSLRNKLILTAYHKGENGGRSCFVRDAAQRI